MDSNVSIGGHVPLELIDDLIDAGWDVLSSEFDETAYAQWKEKAHSCLEALLGPKHYYTVSLTTRVTKARETNLLAGTGILTAARDLIFRERAKPVADGVGYKKIRSREAIPHLRGRTMRENQMMFRTVLNVTDTDVAEIEILAAGKEEAASIVRRVLERKEVSSLDDLDALTLKNLIGFLHTV